MKQEDIVMFQRPIRQRWRNRRFIRSIQKSAENPSDPGNPRGFVCKEIIFDIFVLSAKRGGQFSTEDECG